MGLVESHGGEHCLDYLRFDINSRSWFPKIFETLTLTLGNEMFQFDGEAQPPTRASTQNPVNVQGGELYT